MKSNYLIQKNLKSSSKLTIKDILIDLPEPGKYLVKIYSGPK